MQQRPTYVTHSFVNDKMKICINRLEEDEKMPEEIEFRQLLPQTKIMEFVLSRAATEGSDYIASFFKNLPQIEDLKELSIQIKPFNEIKSEGCQILSSFIGLYKNIRKLDLKIFPNQIGEQGGIYIGQCLEKLAYLEELIIEIGSQNEIGVIGSEGIGHGLKKLINLKNLSISIGGRNFIKGEGAQSLLQGLKALNLDTFKFDIFANEIDDKGLVTLNNELTQIKSLTKLDFSFIFGNTGMYLNGFKTLGQNFPLLENLKIINFQFQGSIDIIQSNYLVHKISELKHLEILNMNFLPLAMVSSYVEINSFLKGVSKCENLKNLSIEIPSCNLSLSADEIEVLNPYQSLENFQFKFGNASIQEDVSRFIGEEIGKMTNLQFLKIKITNNSEIDDQGIQNISKGILNCNLLNTFLIEVGSKNKISSPGYNSIVTSLNNKNYLKSISIATASGNSIDSGSFDSFEEVSKSLTSLESLTIEIVECYLRSDDIIKIKTGLSNLNSLKQYNFVFNRKIYLQDENVFNDSDEVTLNLGQLLAKMNNLQTLKFNYLQMQALSNLQQKNILIGLDSGFSNLRVLELMIQGQLSFNAECFLILKSALSKCPLLMDFDLRLYGRHQDMADTGLRNILNGCNNLVRFTFQIQMVFFKEMKKFKKSCMMNKKIVELFQL